MKSIRRRWKLLVLAALLVVLIISIKLSQRAVSVPLPPVTILTAPYQVPVTARDRFALTFPNNRFVSRLENTFFGPRKSININTTLFSLPKTQATNLSEVTGLGNPLFSGATGVQIWFPDRATFQKVTGKLGNLPEVQIIARPRISTAAGIASSFFAGQTIPLNGASNNVGILAEYIGGARGDVTDLVATIQQSELRADRPNLTNNFETNSISVQTNLNLRARLEIPKGRGIFLIQFPAEPSDQKIFGILIDPIQ